MKHGGPIKTWVLVTVALVAAVVTSRVLLRETARPTDPDLITIRLAHHLLDGPVREAFAAVAREFEVRQAARGRRVRIEQVDIPERSYRVWLRTQLVGGMAPEIMMVDVNGYEDLLVGRYFTVLGPDIVEANPYNEGTSLTGHRWRDTILDGMHSSGYSFRLAEHYGVPIYAETKRIFANRTLMRKVLTGARNADLRDALGPELRPVRFEDFRALCLATQEYARENGLDLVPLVESSTSTDRTLCDGLFRSLSLSFYSSRWDIDRAHRLAAVQAISLIVGGRLTLDAPPTRAGLALMREFGGYMPPGFLQLQRDDTAFLYSQQHALMMAASSTDQALLDGLIGGDFEQVVFPLPTPLSGTPGYGEFAVGPVNELRGTLVRCLGLINFHPPEHRRLALEFLQFLTSVPGQELFTRASGRLPSVLGVPLTDAMRPFAPRSEGYLEGPYKDFRSRELREALDTRLHMLFAPDGGVDAFVDAAEEPFRAAAIEAIRSQMLNSRRGIARQDSLVAAHRWLGLARSGNASVHERRLEYMVDAKDFDEDETLFLRDLLQPVLTEAGL